MNAIQAAAAGPPDRLRLVEVEAPTAGPGEVLVRVSVAGVNFADTMLRRDAYFLPARFPFIPGVEVAGWVETVGADVGDWRPGDRIAGVRLDGGGGYAQYAVLSALHAAKVPDRLGFPEATAVLNQGLTAQGILESAPEIAQGASVLVTAAGGGVGGLIVQLARLAGAGAVIAAASQVDKLTLAAASGAIAVSYAEPSWTREVRAATEGRGVGVALDAIGGPIREALPKAVANRGRIVFYGAASGGMGVTEAFLAQMMGKGMSLTGYSVHLSIQEEPTWLPRTLERLFALVAEGRLRTPIHPPYSMARAAEAHAAIEGRGTTGKVLIQIE